MVGPQVERSAAFRRYAADSSLVVGGLAAILLQLGDPVVARGVAAELLAARAAPWWVRLSIPAAREVTALLLPPALRAAYGIPLHPWRAALVVGFARVLVRVVPRRLRELPSRRLLAALQPRL